MKKMHDMTIINTILMQKAGSLGEARTMKVGLGFPMTVGIRLIWMYNGEGLERHGR
jgi:hypothetical protein